MPDSGFVAVFLIGLVGGGHCLAMCGGIVSALSVAAPELAAAARWRIALAYNLGRIASYSVAGALVGAIGGLGLMLNGVLPAQLVLYVTANLMLLAMGLYLAGLTRLLAPLERLGQRLWQRIHPLTRRYLPARSAGQALPLGALWGWLPCGMVYSALALALLTGSAWRGALLMLAFGLGTLPNLMAAAWLLGRCSTLLARRTLRLVSGLAVCALALFGLLNATTLGGRLWAGVVCAL